MNSTQKYSMKPDREGPLPNPDPSSDFSRVVLEARGLEHWLGEGASRTHVLRGVNLRAERGRTYAVVGSSGCGKSTLLYLLGLLDRPHQGEIFLAGQSVAHASERVRTEARNRHIGFVFQFHFLLGEFTAEENITLPMRKAGIGTEKERRARARDLLGRVGLGDKATRRTTQLSGGEQQRVAIARALANRPSVILADEPTGNLDAVNSESIFDLLQEVASEGQQAIILVSHNPQLAERCDVLLPMRDGAFIGPTSR
jgi:lipoprotein-releasing system ATP-binding protein